ncbi:MAG: TRZ/ATZ family hydrolase [Rhodocyclaceae bacterium]
MPEPINLLVNARWIAPVGSEDEVLERHAVAVDGGIIQAVLPQDEARRLYEPNEAVHLDDHLLIPGLVNLHVHAAMSLMRGIADDLPLMRWLNEAIWPAEGKQVSHGFVFDGTLLAAAEMLMGGITTCNEMYFYPEAAAEAFDQVGMRAVIGVPLLDFPTPYASGPDEYLRKGLAARDEWRNHPTLRFSLAPHAPYTVSDEPLERAAILASELDLPIHMHIQETAAEVDESLARHGIRPLARLERLGLLGPGLIAVHAVHLSDADIDLLCEYDCAVAHCPTSNMKLASGIAPVASMVDKGLRVGLGTDGAASNNRLDMFHEMRHAALLAKVSTLDATALPAPRVLRMATRDGARALGLDDRIGSIEVGKRADLCAVSLEGFETRPCFDPVSHLVFVCGREHVSHVWIDGQPRVSNRKLVLQTHNNELLRISAMWHHKLVGG